MTGNNDKIFQVLLALFFQGAKLKSGMGNKPKIPLKITNIFMYIISILQITLP